MNFISFSLRGFYLAVLFLVSLSLSAAQVVVVSDIDDTIKRSHILGVTKGGTTAFRSDVEFSGMAELYLRIKDQYTFIDKSVSFFYVSNAPEKIMKASHALFISSNSFPKGELMLAQPGEENHKETVIAKIIDQENPEVVFFLGDNGQQDVYVYDRIVNKYKGLDIDFTTYIRIAYSTEVKTLKRIETGSPLQKGQIGFVSAGEIALDLFSKARLDLTFVLSVVAATLDPYFLKLPEFGFDRAVNLPYWYDCSGHHIIDLPLEISQNPILLNHNLRFNKKCNRSSKRHIQL